MQTPTEQTVLLRLAELRPAILARVAEQLAAALPSVGVAPGAGSPEATHHVQMYATAQRFHDLVQLSATADLSLARFEYDWTSRVLGPKGVTWEHQLHLIDVYFALAGQLGGWSDEERVALGQIAGRLRELGAQAYRR